MQFNEHHIGSNILKQACSDPDAFCIEQAGKVFSRGDIAGSAQHLADFFNKENIPSKSAIALICVDRVRGVEAMIALWSIEAQVLFLDPRQTIEEITTARVNAGINAIYTDSPSFARRGGFGLLPSRDSIHDCDINLQFAEGSHNNNALILSSSGTTGLPRYRSITHASFIDGLVTAGRLLNNSIALPTISVGSLAFGAVLSQWIKTLMQGQYLLSLPLFFRTTDLHQALCRPNIKVIGLPPVIIGDLLDFHGEDCATDTQHAYPHIKTMSSIGGPISPETLAKAYRVLTPGVRNMYSMSGVGAVSLLSGKDIIEKPNSVGKPFPEITVRIEDDNGHMQPTGEVGHIIARPDWREGAALIDTGDMGWIDADGYLFIAGRSAQIACRNSINVNLSDLEQDVKKLNGVRDCIAFTTLADGSADDLIFLAVESRTDATDLRATIRSAISSYRRPDQIMISTHLPRTSSNKISLRILKNNLTEMGGDFVDF
ncbi:class I adenylate-forming enzyme family protein [Sulfitobacter guttiformis]|uniref:Acyl-CoA synthetase (AMP-forming)/AMP-acid ligase II n=1 Tax=Sulfitobacter guttiformis TaxID=74349 RepID=A0A420DHP9_9RHOB|nr:class I adenylate-forming enzyme family protein [Sulfitobacter guttiformis]KIN72499.1 AMP-dependent synthetase and ligase [Sulfitobacter guttiformis KCTC 32187]RKE93752.1 acyl-CoA synthetase (AMP-forming)/AMP-acid ligase II [Sulfitobacter guttiformis]